MTFALYPDERHWWSFSDYAHVLETVRALGAKKVLEFGPGSSTLALVEGGATLIDTCEDDPEYSDVYDARIVARFPEIVRMRRYEWADPLIVPGIESERYDLALIDGPRDTTRRPDVLRYALARCEFVLMPAECDSDHAGLQPAIREIAAAAGREVEFKTTGPTAGVFALVWPKC